jgi:predicted RNA-binding protein with PIN domain
MGHDRQSNEGRVELVIDGYNVIGSRGGLHGDVAAKRGDFVAQLGRYGRIKGHAITVVFDGFPPGLATAAGGPSGAVRDAVGVRVLFSEHERADDVIIRMARGLRERGTIVSSDREVRDAARTCGCVVLGAQVFDERLGAALTHDGMSGRSPGHEADKDRDAGEGATGRSDKRGNPRRLSKAERKTRRRLDRL